MMKAQNKNRKHPTCSRCRFHGKKDIRVLQHQCPFRNCTCSSCFLIKRRSIIYRAQKNLDKTEDNSNDAESPGGSVDGSTISNSFEVNSKSGNCSISRSSDSSSDATNFGTAGVASDANSISSTPQSWESLEQLSQHSCIASTSTSASTKSSEHYKISDFQSLCLTFPELTPSQLQSIFEQCGNDFQRTIDRILMTKWCNDTDSRPQFQNNNDWSSSSSAGDYASNVTPFARSVPPLMASDGMPSNIYNANNADHCFDWRSNTCSTASNDDFCNSDYGNDYYYDQGCGGAMSQQGNHQAFSPNWNYEYSPYWYNNSQGSNASNNTSYDVSISGSQSIDDTGQSIWHNGQSGQLALGQTMHDSNM